ncbi:MAG: hypothetical protein JXA92_10500 [candidate division Zixibacteria bacterium]|nr:hypothetical protein [candidate division Zixibacteria bacterium]
MKRIIGLAIVLLLGLSAVAEEIELNEQTQINIIKNYMRVTGQKYKLPSSYALDEEEETVLPNKCGTAALLDFIEVRDKLNPNLMNSLGAELYVRPVLDLSYDSPGGEFKIHYTKTGPDSVYRASVDSDIDGVPDFVERVALIADSVYEHIINELGYPIPPSDGFYNGGGDEKYDIYLKDLQGEAYGLDYPDSAYIGPGEKQSTSFIVLDNDYYEFYILDANNDRIYIYRNRPLDAIRVTTAHEFFHAVQFGIDFLESELEALGDNVYMMKRYWMEMSAVWMEEEVYDNINDYYNYLPYFFYFPMSSIQQFNSYSDPHPYASVVFPIYLSETYGRDIIRDIWLLCGEMGTGPHFLYAAQNKIDSASNGTASLGSAFRDFALWNFFTGSTRAYQAPNNIGYSEKANYIAIPGEAMDNRYIYPTLVPSNQNFYKPEHNAAVYLKFTETRTIHDKYWVCNEGTWDILCHDTTVTLSDTIVCDSVDCAAFACNILRKCDSIACDSFFCDTIMAPLDTTITICTQDRCFDSTRVTEFDFYDKIDSTMLVSLSYDTLTQPWGLTVLFQLDDDPDSFYYDQYLLTANPYIYNGRKFYPSALIESYNPDLYRSITFIASPASTDLTRYEPRAGMYFGFYVPEEGEIDSSLINVPASVLYSYPNPAVVSEMTGDSIIFRFQVPTDTTSFTTEIEPKMVVDIFTVAGEYVGTVERVIKEIDRLGIAEVGWNMTNAEGREVASGVYIAYARLFSDRLNTFSQKRSLLAEDKVKVAIIR